MGILGIKNRTENWKTARTFAPFFNSETLKRKLVRKLEPSDAYPKYVKLELFWKGMRDYMYAKGGKEPTADKLANIYNQPRLFRDLRSQIKEFQPKGVQQLRLPEDLNYRAESKHAKSDLRNNLANTEIDIVLETPKHLYIGEAKHEMGFGRDGSLVLVHQLIRQYVMAKVLVDLRDTGQEIVPFIVWRGAKRQMPAQVQFMVKQGWLKQDNILTWAEVEELLGGQA